MEDYSVEKLNALEPYVKKRFLKSTIAMDIIVILIMTLMCAYVHKDLALTKFTFTFTSITMLIVSIIINKIMMTVGRINSRYRMLLIQGGVKELKSIEKKTK